MSRILIVEDELSYMTLLQSELGERGYEVLVAKDGKEGLEIALKDHPDLILLDIRMPVMDGTTMLSELRKDAYGSKVKVIMLTNIEPDAEIIEGAIKDQPSYYLIKSSIKMEELFEMIDKLLSEKILKDQKTHKEDGYVEQIAA